jgi:hypothetical protein
LHDRATEAPLKSSFETGSDNIFLQRLKICGQCSNNMAVIKRIIEVTMICVNPSYRKL